MINSKIVNICWTTSKITVYWGNDVCSLQLSPTSIYCITLHPLIISVQFFFLGLQGLHLSSNDHKFKTPEPLSSNDSFLNLKIFRAPKTFLFLKFIEISFLVPESQENHCSYQFANHAKSRLQLCLPESNKKKFNWVPFCWTSLQNLWPHHMIAVCWAVCKDLHSRDLKCLPIQPAKFNW